MKKVFVLFFIFFTISIFGQMPTSLTNIHKLGESFSNFEKNNPQYKKEKSINNDDFLIRKKPNYAGNDWNYDLIVISKSYKDDKIASMLFKRYSMSSKEQIKNIGTLKRYLSNQFRANKYSVKNRERQKDLINYISNDPTMKYVDKNFDTKNIEVLLLLEDRNISSLFLFFKYKNQYYIYMSKININDDNLFTTMPSEIKRKEYPVSKVTLPDKLWTHLASYVLKIDETSDITKLVKNKNPEKFKSSTPSVVTVDPKGVVKGIEVGSAFINVTENEYISVVVVPKENFYDVPESQFASLPSMSSSLGGTRDLEQYITEPTFRLAYRFNNKGEWKGASGGNGGIDILFRADNYEWLWTTFYQGGWFYDLNDVKREMINGYQKDTYNGVELTIKPEFVYDKGVPYLQLRHILHNTSKNAIKNQKFGASADVMIHNNDFAPLLYEKYGAYMTDSLIEPTFELMFVAKSEDGVTPVNTLWLGAWNDGLHLYYTYNEILRDVINIDSAIGFSYQNIDLKPDETKEFIVRFTTVKTGEKILEKMEGKIIETNKKIESDVSDDKMISDKSINLPNDIDFDEDIVYSFQDGLAKIKIEDKWGFVDRKGKIVIPCKYDDLSVFNDGLAKAKLQDKYGYIDETDKEIIPIKYEEVSPFVEGLSKVKLYDKYGFVDKKGNEITPVKYDEVSYFEDGLAKAKLQDKYGYIDKTGKEIIPIKYDNVSLFKNSIILVKLNSKSGLIDKNGKEITSIKYDHIFSPENENNLAKVSSDGKYGFINMEGKELIPCIYDYVFSFENDLVKMALNNKYGLVDKTGKEVLSCIYDYIFPFEKNGLAKITLNNKYGLIDKTGKIVVPVEYNSPAEALQAVKQLQKKK